MARTAENCQYEEAIKEVCMHLDNACNGVCSCSESEDQVLEIKRAALCGSLPAGTGVDF